MTLVELLIVIGIIGLLLALLVVGISMYAATSEKKAARARLAVLQNMTGAIAETKSTDPDVFEDFFYSNPVPPPDWRLTLRGLTPALTAGNTAELQARTALLMHRLATIPANRTSLSNMPVDQKLMPGTAGYPPVVPSITNPTMPLVLDNWGKPMVYVSREGISGLSGKAAGKRLVSTGLINMNDPVPANAHGFWISGGPDKDLSTGDDNMYSFEN